MTKMNDAAAKKYADWNKTAETAHQNLTNVNERRENIVVVMYYIFICSMVVNREVKLSHVDPVCFVSIPTITSE